MTKRLSLVLGAAVLLTAFTTQACEFIIDDVWPPAYCDDVRKDMRDFIKLDVWPPTLDDCVPTWPKWPKDRGLLLF